MNTPAQALVCVCVCAHKCSLLLGKHLGMELLNQRIDARSVLQKTGFFKVVVSSSISPSLRQSMSMLSTAHSVHFSNSGAHGTVVPCCGLCLPDD